MGTPTRLAQDDDTFAAMLWNSISDSAIAVMALQSADYTVNGAVSGLLLFKCLLLNSKVKATHNASLIIRKLGKALYIMREVGHDVTKFIFIYRGLLNDLSALGQTYLHGKTHVEEALLDHPDEQFVRYIQHQQDNDRENPPGNTTEQLLNKAQDKIDHIELMKAQAAAEGVPSKEEVLALRAEVQTLKKTVNKFKKGDKDKKGGKSSDKSSDSSTKGSDDSKKKKKKDKKPKKNWPEELNNKPKPADPDKPFIIDGVKYWWCLALNKWVKHAPNECTAKDKKTSNTSSNSSGARNGKTVEATMALLEDMQD
jgi:hypothetical protein